VHDGLIDHKLKFFIDEANFNLSGYVNSQHNRYWSSYFMQDGATPHTANETIPALGGVFGELKGEDRNISKGLWPPTSSDLNPCDFYFWGKLKSAVHANNPHDLEALEQKICEEIYNIQQRELQQVSRNLFKRIQVCLTAEGRHFKHLL
jgi:hypothetical protein